MPITNAAADQAEVLARLEMARRYRLSHPQPDDGFFTLRWSDNLRAVVREHARGGAEWSFASPLEERISLVVERVQLVSFIRFMKQDIHSALNRLGKLPQGSSWRHPLLGIAIEHTNGALKARRRLREVNLRLDEMHHAWRAAS